MPGRKRRSGRKGSLAKARHQKNLPGWPGQRAKKIPEEKWVKKPRVTGLCQVAPHIFVKLLVQCSQRLGKYNLETYMPVLSFPYPSQAN